MIYKYCSKIVVEEVVEIKKLKLTELLNLNKAVNEELKRRNLVRTANITGDLGENLFRLAFGWKLENNSNCGYDATDSEGLKYQIKTRKSENNTIQFGAIRDIDHHAFDYLAILVLHEDFSVRYAALMPQQLVKKYCKHQDYTNSELPIFNISQLQKENSVKDVTTVLQKVMSTL